MVIGLIFGYLYQGVGANANQILANYVYLYGTLLLNVYTGKMSVTLQCKCFDVTNWTLAQFGVFIADKIELNNGDLSVLL